MKALTLHQPWASAIALGLKQYETRSWRTDFRGRMAIHAARDCDPFECEFAQAEYEAGRLPEILPFGAVLCIVELEVIQSTEYVVNKISDRERHFGDYTPGRWAWRLKVLRVFEQPIKNVRGYQGLWNWAEREA